MRWLPKARHKSWWIISGGIGAVQFATISIGANMLAPHSNPKYAMIALFCLATGFVIGGAGWLGARWLPPIATLGLSLGLFMMLNSFSQMDGWGDIIGMLSLMFLLLGGLGLGLIVELGIWTYRTRKVRKR